MYVLKRIHRWLRSDGLLLDLHPEPEQPTIDAVRDGMRLEYLGRIDTSGLITNIYAARAALASLIEAGWFVPERSLIYDFISHFSSVDEWLRHREERRSSSVVEPAVIARARALLAQDGRSELRVSERVLASRFRRTHAPHERVAPT